MDPSVPTFKARKRGKGKKPVGELNAPTDSGPSTATSRLSALRQGPLSRKRQRSSTSRLPQFDELQHATPLDYYIPLLNHSGNMSFVGDVPPVGENIYTCILWHIMGMIHKDYWSAIDGLVEIVDILTEVIVDLKAKTPHPETPTPLPFKVAETKPSEVKPDPKPPLATGLPPYPPPPCRLW